MTPRMISPWLAAGPTAETGSATNATGSGSIPMSCGSTLWTPARLIMSLSMLLSSSPLPAVMLMLAGVCGMPPPIMPIGPHSSSATCVASAMTLRLPASNSASLLSTLIISITVSLKVFLNVYLPNKQRFYWYFCEQIVWVIDIFILDVMNPTI